MTILFGEVKCGKCSHVNINPQLNYLNDEEMESIVYCEHCKKWVKWS
jgi:hypothetical protein